ncbi:hypothetical protein RQP46_000539 [Phenoliferia psychrophenolica]
MEMFPPLKARESTGPTGHYSPVAEPTAPAFKASPWGNTSSLPPTSEGPFDPATLLRQLSDQMATLTKEVGETRSQVASLTQEAIETKRWKERFEKHLALGRITLDPVMESCLSYSYLLKLKWELEYGSTVPGGIGAPAFWESEVNRMKDLEGMKGSWAEAYKRVRDNMREFDKDPGRPTSFGTDIAEQRRKFEAEREPAAYTHYEFQRIKAPDVERKFGKESRQIYQQLVEKVCRRIAQTGTAVPTA